MSVPTIGRCSKHGMAGVVEVPEAPIQEAVRLYFRLANLKGVRGVRRERGSGGLHRPVAGRELTMVTYEITATVDTGLVEAYERYMRQRHIPDVLATGHFQRAVFACAAPGRYRIRYDAPSDGDLERYLAQHAPRLREDFASHFPAGATLSREVWTVVEAWDPRPAL